MTTKQILINAKKAKSTAVLLDSDRKNKILMCMADALIKNADLILDANKNDIENAKRWVLISNCRIKKHFKGGV